MRRRPSARLLVLDRAGRILLFHFVHKTGPLAGEDYWATPGGAVEEGETFEQAAIRELEEETGVRVESVGAQVARREFVLQLPDGERVLADERFFLIAVDSKTISRDGWTTLEAALIADHRWWTPEELTHSSETVWPENLLEIIMATRSRQA